MISIQFECKVHEDFVFAKEILLPYIMKQAARPAPPVTEKSVTEGAPIKADPVKTEAPKVEITKELVVETLAIYGREKGALALKKVLDNLGVKRVGELPPDKYAQAMSMAMGDI